MGEAWGFVLFCFVFLLLLAYLHGRVLISPEMPLIKQAEFVEGVSVLESVVLTKGSIFSFVLFVVVL